MVVFEDAISGLVAARAAGARAIAMAGTLRQEELDAWEWLPHYEDLVAEAAPPGLRIRHRGRHPRPKAP